MAIPFSFLQSASVKMSAYRAIIAGTLRHALRPTPTKHKAL